MAVLDQIDAARLGPEFGKACRLVGRLVRAVIDHNVERAKRSEERHVSLVTDVDLEPGLLEVALVPDVDSDD